MSARRSDVPCRASSAIALSLGLAGGAMWLQGCEQAATPGVAMVLPRVRTVGGAISLFQRSCASCHGSYGEFFDPPQRAWTLRECKDIVGQMVRQRTSEKPGPEELDALAMYVQSIRDSTPFISVSRREHDVIAGEVSPGCQVVVRAGGRELRAPVADHLWSVALPEGTVIESIIARRADGAHASIADPQASALSIGSPRTQSP